MLNSENRYRKRARESRNRFFRFLAIALIIAFASYKLGLENMRSRDQAYRAQINKLQEDRMNLEEIITSLRADIQSNSLRDRKLEDKYNNEIPKGKLKKLYDTIKKQLDLGVSFNRINSIITSARPPKNCNKPITRRFILKTNMYKGADGGVSFANGAIRIRGNGQSIINSKGKREAWYDSGKSISIIFTVTGGKKIEKSGILPIYKSIVIDNREYRFTIASGARSFINITADSCDSY